jgi:hypothetical protein
LGELSIWKRKPSVKKTPPVIPEEPIPKDSENPPGFQKKEEKREAFNRVQWF